MFFDTTGLAHFLSCLVTSIAFCITALGAVLSVLATFSALDQDADLTFRKRIVALAISVIAFFSFVTLAYCLFRGLETQA